MKIAPKDWNFIVSYVMTENITNKWLMAYLLILNVIIYVRFEKFLFEIRFAIKMFRNCILSYLWSHRPYFRSSGRFQPRRCRR